MKQVDEHVQEAKGFRFHGTLLALDADAMSVGNDLWSGLSDEKGEDAARRLLLERLDAAGRALGVPPGPVPDMDTIASTPPAGTVMVSSMAALVAGGVLAHPED